ncbi:MAG: hypothetical protein CMI60_07675 [Parvibaculum sp.]|jgi:hypothetical protein|nr:hypothetical protein [Parvibaculum sp.]|tara:strand:- start:1896 stop:2282 length:387 start_codon:yes stop_codon:yes gene_type:complete
MAFSEFNEPNVEGFYRASFAGHVDFGEALLVLVDDLVAGADSGGVSYDGFYRLGNGSIDLMLTLTVPQGTSLVQGVTARDRQLSFKVDMTVPLKEWASGVTHRVETAYGPVNVIIKKLRNFPRRGAFQ